MAGQIEKMTRMRRNILWGVLMEMIVAFFFLIYPTIYALFHQRRYVSMFWENRLLVGAFLLWFLIILFFLTRYLLFKKRLKKDPFLHMSVYDERVKRNWLRACRFAFFVAVGITILRKGNEMFFFKETISFTSIFPYGPSLILWGGVISLVGSFLYYNREAKNE